MGTYGIPSSNDNRFGDQGRSEGRSLETNGVPSSGDNGLGGQGPPGGSGFGRPSGTYGAPASSGTVFSTQRTSVGHEFGGQPSGATTSGNSRFGDQMHSGGHPLGGYGAISGGINRPSNVHISSSGGVGRHSQKSPGIIGSQNTGTPSSFHNAPGPNGGYNGSPSGASNAYLPPASGGSLGSQGPPRNNGFGGQHGFGPGSSNTDGSNNGPIAYSGNRNGDFSGQKPSGSYDVPVGGGPNGGSGTYRPGSFTRPSNGYLPTGSSFNDRQFSGSFNLGDTRPGGNGFSSSRDGTSHSYDNQGSDATGFGRSSPGSPNSYSSSGSGGSYGPGSPLNRHEVPQPGGLGLRPQIANSGNGGSERNGFQRLPTSYNESSRDVPPGTRGFPSQRQQDVSAFEGYKY